MNGVLAPARRSRQAQQAIQERIKDWILDHGLDSGDPMPTESELVQHLNVSRNSTREALKALQALGIVEIRHGFGTYVGDCSLEPFADALIFRGRKSIRSDRHELREIVDLRQALEAGLMSLLIETVDEAALARLRTRLEQLEAHAGQGELGDAADRAFHDELYAAIGNQLMRQLLRVFWDVYHDLSHELPPAEEDQGNIVEVHREIYEAIAARDAARATAAVNQHFAGIQRRLDAVG
jgi:DNA-binding FadR family transcriptional regulator